MISFTKTFKVLSVIAFSSVLFLMSCGMKNPTRNEAPDLFGIYTSTLDGKNMKMIVSDSYREINHARVSPDNKWITFTRFNLRGPNGLAEEKHVLYGKTEIMIIRTDGTGLESLTPPRRGIVAANSYWTPDSKGVIFISNDNPKRQKELHYISLATRKIRRVPTPKNILPGDPHQVGDWIVFPTFDFKGEKNVIWIMKADGEEARQLTRPIVPKAPKKQKQTVGNWQYGDFDPKISPDGTKVAFWRHVPGGQLNWHTFIIDIKTGEEIDLSPKNTFDGMPEWSSDGKLLIFYHIDPKNIRKMGLYTIKSDGNERKKISLPKGYLYSQPSFFPGEGSGEKTRIIFSAKKVPQLK